MTSRAFGVEAGGPRLGLWRSPLSASSRWPRIEPGSHPPRVARRGVPTVTLRGREPATRTATCPTVTPPGRHRLAGGIPGARGPRGQRQAEDHRSDQRPARQPRPARPATKPQNPSEAPSRKMTAWIEWLNETPATASMIRSASAGAARRRKRDSVRMMCNVSLPPGRLCNSACRARDAERRGKRTWRARGRGLPRRRPRISSSASRRRRSGHSSR